MKLSSVGALKEELLAISPALVEHVGSVGSFRAFNARRETIDATMRHVAFGIACSGKNNYCLAVRLQQTGPLMRALIEEIHREARGEIQVRYIGNVVKLARKRASAPPAARPMFYQARRRPLRIGSSISDVSAEFESAGTLGCFVSRQASRAYIGILTNNHVVANENGGAVGEPILQPGTLDLGKLPSDQIGELGPFVPLRAGRKNLVDAAIAYLHEDVSYDSRQVGVLGGLSGVGDIIELPENAAVYKVGRTSGQTEGRISAFEVDNVSVQYDMGFLRFDGQIEIEGAGAQAFSDSGDSGGLVVDGTLRAIGLLFAGGDEGGQNGKGLAYANPIEVVLNALKVNLER